MPDQHWQYICDKHSAFVLLQGSATLSMAYAGTKFISSVSTLQGMSIHLCFHLSISIKDSVKVDAVLHQFGIVLFQICILELK